MADTAAETTAPAEAPAETTETTAATAAAAEETTDAAHTPTDQPDTSDAPDTPSESAAGGDSGGTADTPAAAGLADALGAGDAETVTETTAPAAEPATAPEPEPTAEAPATGPAPAPLARDIVDITHLADLGITDTTSLPDALQALATAVTTATENRAIDALADAHGIPHAAARDSISLRDAIHTGDQAKIQAAIQGISQRVIGTRGASTIETALAGAAVPATTGPVSTLSALESALSGQAH